MRSEDAATYTKGTKVSDAEMDAINIARDEFHGEWNYTQLRPNHNSGQSGRFTDAPFPRRHEDRRVDLIRLTSRHPR